MIDLVMFKLVYSYFFPITNMTLYILKHKNKNCGFLTQMSGWLIFVHSGCI